MGEDDVLRYKVMQEIYYNLLNKYYELKNLIDEEVNNNKENNNKFNSAEQIKIVK